MLKILIAEDDFASGEFLKEFSLKGKPRKSEDFQGSEKGGNFSQK